MFLVAAQPGEEEVWQGFLTWLKTAKATDSPGALFADYQKHLASAGASDDEVKREYAIVSRLMRTRDDGWQVMFNNIYASKQPGFSVRPNGTLVAAVENRKPGRALDAGMGQGRNSVFLALKGWDVTGFDISDEGLAVARKDASKAGVKIRAVQISGAKFDYGTNQWDLIVFSYVPFPLTDPAFVHRLTQALRPGGLVVVESFASDSSAKHRKPVDIDPPRMKAAFEPAFKIHRFEDQMDTPDWTTEKSRLVRMVAEKNK